MQRMTAGSHLDSNAPKRIKSDQGRECQGIKGVELLTIHIKCSQAVQAPEKDKREEQPMQHIHLRLISKANETHFPPSCKE